jgi:hypothetical protein
MPRRRNSRLSSSMDDDAEAYTRVRHFKSKETMMDKQQEQVEGVTEGDDEGHD